MLYNLFHTIYTLLYLFVYYIFIIYLFRLVIYGNSVSLVKISKQVLFAPAKMYILVLIKIVYIKSIILTSRAAGF